jgi:small subunit ribosomal protein S7
MSEQQIEQPMKKATEFIEKSVDKIKENVEEVIENVKEKVSKVIDGETPKKPKKSLDDKKSSEAQLVFDLYDISEVEVKDPGLKSVINLKYSLVIKSRGRHRERFGKAQVNIVERLINTVSVPGHRGKKHKVITRWATGKYNKNAKQVLDAFKIIHDKTKKNPLQVLVEAIEQGSPKDEVTMIQYGGARYPQSVDSSPLRRVSIALRNIVHGAYDKSFNKKKTFSQALAEELIATSNGSGDAAAVSKKNELERQADSAR